MIPVAHIQGIARFIVGFGTEEDMYWRDYNLDFDGCIKYGNDGVPTKIEPVDSSGYSLGSVQLDFGQMPGAAEPFITAFETWLAANPTAAPLASDRASAILALTKDGKALRQDPASGLRQQDVKALAAYVRSPAGSDWVNTQIDNYLIGNDQQLTVSYSGENYGYSLVGIARRAEGTAAFQNYAGQGRSDMTDLIYAMAMKTYNQGQTACTQSLLPFLSGNPPEDQIENWPPKGQFSDALKTGVTSAVNISQIWTKLIAAQPPQWLADIKNAVETQSLANPRAASASSGIYLATRAVFENSDLIRNFVNALQTGVDYFPAGVFDLATGAIVIVGKTGRIHQGVMVKNQVGYAWDTAGDAYKLVGGAWSKIDIGTITIPHPPAASDSASDAV
jgi:hypothetical protein